MPDDKTTTAGEGAIDFDALLDLGTDESITPDPNDEVKDEDSKEAKDEKDVDGEGADKTDAPATETKTAPAIDTNDPVQRAELTKLFNEWVADAQSNATRDAAAKEIDALVREGTEESFGKLGKKFAEQYLNLTTERDVGAKVLKTFTTKLYDGLFEHEAFNDLSSEAREALDPRKFSDDATYIKALNTFIAHYEVQKLTKAKGEESEAEVKAAADGAAVTDRVAAAAATTLPSGNSGGPPDGGTDYLRTSGRDLLREGLEEMLTTKSK